MNAVTAMQSEDSMRQEQHYSRSPITEAIIDLRTVLQNSLQSQQLDEIYSRIRGEYPVRVPLIAGSVTFQPGATVQFAATQLPNGVAFQTEDKRQVLQITAAGFTFNRLRPYDRWETFRSEAKRLWDVYAEVCVPVTIQRAAVRYINRLDIPSGANVEEYLNTFPRVAPGLPMSLDKFFMQLQMQYDDIPCRLVINEVIAPQTEPTIVPIILDLDFSSETGWQGDDEGVWDYFDRLRARKNQVFEVSITQKARRLFYDSDS